MRKFMVDKNTIWEETGHFRFIPSYSPQTFSYIKIEYREFYKDKLGQKIVEGPPIYLHNLSSELVAFIKIYAEAQAAIMATIPAPKGLKEVKQK